MSRATPMMEQYGRIKAEHQDALLLFRMGDFYETFFDDAKIASRVLGLALTTRDRGSANPIPLAGIPHHALESYLARLVRAGYRVAICDQVEDPRKAKGLVKREVTEIVTPGTVLSSSMLDERRGNFLMAVAPGEGRSGLARIDLSTGEFLVSEIASKDLRREILRSDAAELLVPEGGREEGPLASILADVPDIPITEVAAWEFGVEEARATLRSHFGVANLDGFGLADLDAAVSAAGAALRYLKDMKRRNLDQITSVRALLETDRMVLDETTQRNLELVEPLEGGLPSATLLAILDRTATPMGARLLRRWILFPLIDCAAIRRRHDAVEGLMKPPLSELRGAMEELCDMQRITGRAATGHATPRDLAALRQSIELLPTIGERLAPFEAEAVREMASAIPDLSDVGSLLRDALVESPPASLKSGGAIRAGYDRELDSIRAVARDGKGWISRLQAAERERTGIANLKVGYNKVFGYYIEVTRPNVHLVPDDYVGKQTLVNAERYVTPELKEHESKVLTAEEDMLSLERRLFDSVRAGVAESATSIQKAAETLARIDVLAALAELAAENRYVRPTVRESGAIVIEEGRHPVVEQLLEREEFVPNDVLLGEEESRILLITGPNMAGKSTYLRQVALTVVMAQMGSFVPARSASMAIVDRIFTRIGAADALARGRSTFLVEMSETANILRNATPRSLVLLDEIGRGTSTFDGLSLAWAVTEYLHDGRGVAPRTMFATHYHELTELEYVLPGVRNMNVLVRKTGDTIAFLRKVVPGRADQSYGIEVARLAGIPEEVIVRAKEVLRNLEETQYTVDAVPRLAEGDHGPLGSGGPQLHLFRERTDVEREIESIDVERMTPLDALGTLAELKERLRRGE